MHERLAALRAEFEEIQTKLQDPAVYADQRMMAKLGRRSRELQPLMKLIEEHEKLTASLKESESMKDDPEMGAIAVEEGNKATERLSHIEKSMEEYLAPRDPMADRNVVLEVRAGTGGEEAALFAAELMRMYLRFCEERGWKAELLDRADAEAGGIKEAVIRIEGPDAYGSLKYEGGVHRVQRIPATENKGRVHTSAATVAVLPEAEEQDLVIRNEDLRVDTYRASGAGGQHVNKTESAVRITHIPTGVMVACQSERSQLQNRERAMELLRTRLYAAEQERQAKEHGNLRTSQIKTGDRSEKIRTYKFPQDRLTDHRIGENFHSLPGIMEGNIGPVIEALKKKDKEEQMKSASPSPAPHSAADLPPSSVRHLRGQV
ncbi:peptide chain release factor 1 [Candidatus Peregrinibacteria bacterium]|nr:peptide chain release factor 1 [Candidatus Peregrinibacteria bacterium]